MTKLNLGAVVALAASLMLFSTAKADEGMWQPYQLPAIADELAGKGL